MKYFDSKRLATTMRQVFDAKGVASDSALHVIASLIQTSLRGVDSHGINLFPHYCHAVDVDRINKTPKMVIHQSASGTALVDADHGFGHHAGTVAMDKAIELAKENGIGAVSVANSTHFGAAAYFGLRAPEKECIGFAFTNADALVKVYNGKEAFFGTNPICFTAPLKKENPFCLDMATSIVSWNKINNNRRENRKIPSNWAFDKEGNTVTNPHQAATLNPIGEYKGFGLGMMVDILCGSLAGSLTSKDILPMYDPPPDSTKRYVSHFFMAIDIARFIKPDLFKKNLQSIVDRIRTVEAAIPGNRVLTAGDPEKITFEKRKNAGIPVDETKYSEFLGLSGEFRRALNS